MIMRRLRLAALVFVWIIAAAMTTTILVRIIRVPFRGGPLVNVFVGVYVLLFFAVAHTMLMIEWRAYPLGAGRSGWWFWRLVFAPRPATTPESSAWWWGRAYVALMALGVLMFLGLCVASKSGLFGKP